MIYRKSAKSPKSSSGVIYASSHYKQQQSGKVKKSGCGCGTKKIVIKD